MKDIIRSAYKKRMKSVTNFDYFYKITLLEYNNKKAKIKFSSPYCSKSCAKEKGKVLFFFSKINYLALKTRVFH